MDATLYATETEQALLNVILLDPEVLTGIDIQPTDFWNQRNRWVFDAIEALRQRGQSIDFITVHDELETRKHLAEIGEAYLIGITTVEAHTWSAAAYAAILREKSKRRNLLAIANDAAKMATDSARNLDADLPGLINRMVDAAKQVDEARQWSVYFSELYDEVEARMANPGDTWGIPTGVPTWDKLTGGLQRGELFILSGEPGMGKSMLAMDIAPTLAKSVPGAIFSLEMPGMQVARRLASGNSEVPTHKLKTGRLAEGEAGKFADAVEHLAGLNIYMSDGSGWTTTSMRAELARLKARYGVQWFILDYLFLLNDGGANEIERTATISKGLKRTCRELNMAGLAIHSMNKAGMNGGAGAPEQQSLRGSGQVIYDADTIAYLVKWNTELDPKFNPESKIKDYLRLLLFAKGREIETKNASVRLIQRPGLPSFGELEKRTL